MPVPPLQEWRGYIRLSVDGGRTWSEARQMARDLVGPTKNPPLMLEDGTMLSPSSDENGDWSAHVEVSRDYGYSWERQRDISYGSGIIQPAIFRTLDGKLHMLMRSRRDGAVATESTNDGRSWRSPQRRRIDAPNAGLSAITLADGRVAVVHNDDGRHVLRLSLSDDNGDSYKVAATLENERDRFRPPRECVGSDRQEAEFSYPSIIQAQDGLLHITYTYSYYGSGDRCFGRENIKHLVLDPCQLGEPRRAPLPCVSPGAQSTAVGRDDDEEQPRNGPAEDPRSQSPATEEEEDDERGCRPSDSARDLFSARSRGVRNWSRQYSRLSYCLQRCAPEDGYAFVVEHQRLGDCFCYRSADEGSSAARWGYRWPDNDDDDDNSDVDEGQLRVYDLSEC